MAAGSLDQLFAEAGVIKKQPKAAASITPTHQPSNRDQILTVPAYRQHIDSLRDDRLSQTSQQLLQTMFKNDPDVSAAVGSFLTLADTPLTALVRDLEGNIDTAATKELPKLIRSLTSPLSYLEGFSLKPNMAMLCQELRYMLMLRGVLGSELVFDKKLRPSRLQHVDMASVEWFEKEPGVYKPRQKVQGKSEGVSLDIPSFFVAFHRRDPTTIYGTSDFVSVINTVAARTQVINDLYRIMQLTGFPRIDISVLEETLMKNAPPSLKDDVPALNAWANDRLSEVQGIFTGLRSDQSFVHFDSIQAKILNDKNPGAALDISNVIEVLNAQNQAALKTMATVIGRGNAGVNTASVEARIAAMNADQLNVPIKQILDQALTFLLNVYGIPGYVEVTFAPAELRPDMELEPQKTLKSARLRMDLSDGIITDEEYHLAMYGRLPPTGAEVLSGTKFMTPVAPTMDAGDVSAQDDPLGKGQSGEGSPAKQARGNAVKKKTPAPARASMTDLALSMIRDAKTD